MVFCQNEQKANFKYFSDFEIQAVYINQCTVMNYTVVSHLKLAVTVKVEKVVMLN